jgi:hypothetical protein
MKHHTHLHFRTGLSLEELAAVIELQDVDFDAENEHEWAIGVCDGIDKIDICRSHKVAPQDTETTLLRFAHGMDSIIPTYVLVQIARRLLGVGISEVTVTGFDTWGTFLHAPISQEFDRYEV